MLPLSTLPHRYALAIASLLGMLASVDCVQQAVDHCDNNGGDQACAEWYPGAAPYCWVCTGENRGCGDTRPTDPACFPSGTSTGGGSTTSTTDASMSSTTLATADSTASSDSSTGAVCGDGIIDTGEVCDGDNVGGLDCIAVALGEGMLGCAVDCTGYDVSACAGTAVCGDGVLQGNEDCDGTDLGMQGCADIGFEGGTLSCTVDCTFDNEMCNRCGNGEIDDDEQCDGDNLNRDTCASIAMGFVGGTLACTAECTFDPAMCCFGLLHGCDVNDNCCSGNCIDLACL